MTSFEELDQKVDDLRQLLHVYREEAKELEAEAQRLENLRLSQETTEARLNKRLSEHEQRKRELDEQEEYLKKERELLNKREERIKSTELQHATLKADIAAFEKRKEDFDKQELDLAERTDKLNKAEEELESKMVLVRQYEIDKQKQAEYANVLMIRERKIKEREDHLAHMEELTRI